MEEELLKMWGWGGPHWSIMVRCILVGVHSTARRHSLGFQNPALGLYCTEYKSWVSSLEEPLMIIPEFCLGYSGRKNIAKAIVNGFGLLPLPRACLACFEQQQGGKQGILSIFVAAANKPLSHQPCYSSGSFRLMRECLDSWEIRELQIFFLVVQKNLKSFCKAGYMC